jgi:hypothetical protein
LAEIVLDTLAKIPATGKKIFVNYLSVMLLALALNIFSRVNVTLD